MSHTTLWKVYKTTCSEIEEYGNAWLSAPPLWDLLWKEYINPTTMWISSKDLSVLWKLSNDLRVPYYLRIAHTMTFDRAIIKQKNFYEVCNALISVDTELKFKGYCSNSHWAAIANKIYELRLDKKALGVGLGSTSVEDSWEHYRFKRGKVKPLFDVIKYANGEI